MNVPEAIMTQLDEANVKLRGSENEVCREQKKPVTILRRHGQGIRGLEVQMQFHRTADEVAIGIHQAEDDEVHGALSIQRVRGDG